LARSRPGDKAISRQLTLDDWDEMLNASAEAPKAPPHVATNVDASASAGPAEKANAAAGASARHHSAAPELLETPGALLTRTHLRELGLERRAVDAVFRALPVVALPGYSRPMIRAQDYLRLAEEYTYRDDRVRPASQNGKRVRDSGSMRQARPIIARGLLGA
jgi:hypothetical protein